LSEASITGVFPGIYFLSLEGKRILVTENLTSGRTVYGEALYRVNNVEYRSWNPSRSKLAAAIMKGVNSMPIGPGCKVLYLGAASGTTLSHVSDIVGYEGHVWGVEFSPRSIRDLIEKVSRYRRNVSPILADARNPWNYTPLVLEVDVIFADVAQPEQAKILIENSEMFLKKGGWAMLSIKSRSIDVSRSPEDIYESQVELLIAKGFTVQAVVDLEPFEKDHAMVIALYP
jgi:fibrillarin-like pre-rRNA processing protein